MEELQGFLKAKYAEYQRKLDFQFGKQIGWHLNKMYCELTVSREECVIDVRT